MIICQICGREFKNNIALGTHISITENTSVKEYYDKYLLKNNENKCYCGKETKFKNLNIGYNKYCSTKCVSNNIEILNKKKETSLKNYGVDHPQQSYEIREKVKKTNLKKYGCEHSLQSSIIKEKCKKTCLEKFGVENPIQNKKIKNKSKRTCLNKFGVENPGQSSIIKEKIKETSSKNFYDRLLTSDRLEGKVIPLFTLEEYKGIESKYLWKCNECNNEFEDHLQDGRVPRCYKCYPRIQSFSSLAEKELSSFCKVYYPNLIENDRKILNGKELDIYISEINLAIEYNGLYWHSESQGKDKYYHYNKYKLCKDKSIELIQIFEDEWINKQEIVKSILLNRFDKINNEINIEDCIIKEINLEESNLFLNNNHLERIVISEINIGLFYNNELISLLSINKKNTIYKILRFCNKINYNIPDSFSTLFKYFNNIYLPKTVIYYLDLRYESDKYLLKNNFQLNSYSQPNYYYIKINDLTRYSELEIYDKNLTEWQNIQLGGYDRIWDCGYNVFTIKL